MKNLETENYLEEGSDIQEKLEKQLEKSIDVIDTKKLKKLLVLKS